MPMHDWTRVRAGTYHDFHCSWLADSKNRLNGGVLPADHYAQVEQVMEGMTADILTLRMTEPQDGSEEEGESGLAVAVAPPKVRLVASLEEDLYTTMAKHITIRHGSDDRVVAMIELVSPGNKASEYAFGKFIDKALAALAQGCHLLVIDPFPPSPRDPLGIHGAIWSKLGGRYDPPADKPLTMVAYAAGRSSMAYVEPFAVGDVLTSMPLFLRPERYVPVPLEESYMAAFQGVPRRWREVLSAITSAGTGDPARGG